MIITARRQGGQPCQSQPRTRFSAHTTSSGFITNPDDYTVDFGPDAGTAEVTTYPEQLQAAGVSWQVYTNDQVGDSGSFPDFFLGDFGDNPLWFYQQYNTTNSRNGGTGALAVRGAATPWKTDAGRRR